MIDRDDLSLLGEQEAAAAAARDYDAAWAGRLGLAADRTLELLVLKPGERVLDVACGTGGAAVLAGRRVAPGGKVIGVDLSPDMLELGRQKVRAASLNNVTFADGDMTRLDLPGGDFDAVMCILGIFFADDMAAAAAELWRMVRPGGRLVVTTLGRQLFAPMSGVLVEAARLEDPGVWVDFTPRRTSEPGVLAQVLRAGGVSNLTITVEQNRIPLLSPDEWWQIVMGTGLRRSVLGLGPAAAARIREHNAAWIHNHQVDSLSLDLIYAVAVKA